MIGDFCRDHFYSCIVCGIALQCFGGLMPLGGSRLFLPAVGWAMVVGGTLLTVTGFAFYAKTKGRSLAWSLLALASVFGWGILVLLKPKQSHVADKTSVRGAL